MPLRDIELLFGGQYFETLDWLMEHVRLALLTRSSWGAAKAIPWDVFLEHVLPYAALDEKRDVAWRWRPRFYELFFANASSYVCSEFNCLSSALMLSYIYPTPVACSRLP